jgi:hypothetical protein
MTAAGLQRREGKYFRFVSHVRSGARTPSCHLYLSSEFPIATFKRPSFDATIHLKQDADTCLQLPGVIPTTARASVHWVRSVSRRSLRFSIFYHIVITMRLDNIIMQGINALRSYCWSNDLEHCF